MKQLWIGVSLLAAALWPTRVVLALVLAGLLMLLLHEQGQDLVVRLGESDGDWATWSLFFVATAWWAVQSWLWARIALDRRFGPIAGPPAAGTSGMRTLNIRMFTGEIVTSTTLDWMVRGIPRFYALLVFLLAAGAIFFQTDGASAWIFIAAGIGLALFLWKRRSLIDPLRRPVLARALGGAAPPSLDRWSFLFGVTRPARLLTMGSLAVAILMSIAVWWLPGAQTIGTWLGAPTVTFLAFASILGVLGLATGLSHLWAFPVIGGLLVLGGLAAAVIPWRDHHTIPPVQATVPLEGRRSFEAAWAGWQKANPPGPAARPIVFVATAGGGVRAALWTTVVLDRARQLPDPFDSRVFAVSGVSGGALGATAYLAGLSSGTVGAAGPCGARADKDGLCGLGQLGRTMFSADMLGPTFAAAFYGDLLFTFAPLPTPINSADALTETWREAWRRATAGRDDGFARPFLQHWTRAEGWRPVLLLNGTHVESGKRLITTDLQLGGTKVRDSWDLHQIMHRDIDTAMAALNAARFPGVVAAGTVTTADGKPWGHVIDGGYFENSGAIGAMELAADVAEHAEARGRAEVADGRPYPVLKPVFIEIVSDPAINSRDWGRATSLAACYADNQRNEGLCEAAEPMRWLIGLRGPLAGILNVRSGHGIWSPSHFHDAARRFFRDRDGRAIEGTAVQFRLCPPKAEARVPLGWQLSAGSVADIVGSLPTIAPVQPSAAPDSPDYRRWACEEANFNALQALGRALSGK
jgi:hypothetical protein